MPDVDAVVVGSGPNGLAAAVELARAGLGVRVYEAADAIGGGTRTEELTRPGFLHDVCSAVHPMAAASPFFASLPLEEHGLEWVHPPTPLAHPLGDGRAAVLERSPDATEEGLAENGETPDGNAGWQALVEPFVEPWDDLATHLLGPPLRLPRRPLLLARFGLRAVRSAEGLLRGRLRGGAARALFAGLAAHSVLPLERRASAAVGLVLGLAGHGAGWPVARGGSGRIAAALASLLRSHGGTIRTGTRIRHLDELPSARAVLLDLTPAQVLQVAGPKLPRRYRRALSGYRYGPGVFKVDWALDGPIPWRAPACRRAGTVHVGGGWREIVRSEAAPWNGRVADRPFVLLAQPSLFDDERAPAGRHTAWAYCHVPHGWYGDATDRIEDRIEAFAPGFRNRVLARSTLAPADLEARNPNLVGGDIGGGAQDLRQIVARPTLALRPYRTPVEGLYLCSSSTPPGGGVHGMCGFHAARTALGDRFS